MNSKLSRAKLAQYISWMFLPAGFLWGQFAIAKGYTFEGIAVGFAVIAVIFVPTFLVPFLLKCRQCGVSYFYSSKSTSRDFSGVDLLRPVPSQCQKCGARRD
jgi:hypothetical protein